MSIGPAMTSILGGPKALLTNGRIAMLPPFTSMSIGSIVIGSDTTTAVPSGDQSGCVASIGIATAVPAPVASYSVSTPRAATSR